MILGSGMEFVYSGILCILWEKKQRKNILDYCICLDLLRLTMSFLSSLFLCDDVEIDM